MRVGSLFAGIGGFDLAAERAGMEVAWQSEVDTYASRVLAHHWPIANYGDIHDIRRPPAVDVLTGGFPCQDYSVAGNRGGLAGDRGALWWEYHRLIDSIRPTWVVGENVPGLLSSRNGRDFETIVGSLTECGYGVAWAVLDAQYFGVAQRRRRVFIVGHSGGEPRPEILALSEGMFGDTPPSRETGPAASALTANGVGAGGGPDDNAAQAHHLIPSTVGPLTTHMQAPRGTETTDSDHVLVASPGGFGDYEIDDTTGPLRQVAHKGPATSPVAFNWQQDSGSATPKSEYVDNLISQQVPAVAWPDPAPTVRSQQGGTQDPGKYNAVVFAQNLRNATAVTDGATVRRLTPLECERLQGFPDNWTDIPGNSDTQRYRQLGNAVAVPVVEWIMRRIAA
jgi:DNA (cytosine-5)-methyltransferase 1